MLEIHKNNTAKLGSKALEENPNLTPRGIFVDIERPEYCASYDEVIKHAMKEDV